MSSLRILYHDFPDLWKRLKKMDEYNIAHPKDGYERGNAFHINYSVQDLEDRFKQEDNGKRIAISLWEEP